MHRLRLCILLSLLAIAAAAEEPLSSWFATSPAAGRYESIRGDLRTILADAERRGIPAELFMTRIAEGAEKRVASDKLVAALRKDLENYFAVLSIISKTMSAAPENRQRTDLLARGGMALRAGMDTGTFEQVFSDAVRRDVPPRRAIDALIAVAAVDSRMPLDGEGKRSLASSLAASSEKEERFSLLSSLLLRGKTGKIGTRDLVALAVSILDSGGGFLQLENEITRRLK
jgi:hypothetical protein